MNLTWTTQTREIVEKLVANMRPADVQELWLSAGLLPADALAMLVGLSDAVFVAMVDGEPVYIFGGTCGTAMERSKGTCWGLGTEWLDSHGITMAKLTRRGWAMLWDALPEVQVMSCRIWADCEKTLAWAEWMGAKLRRNEAVSGAKGGVFIPYTIERA